MSLSLSSEVFSIYREAGNRVDIPKTNPARWWEFFVWRIVAGDCCPGGTEREGENQNCALLLLSWCLPRGLSDEPRGVLWTGRWTPEKDWHLDAGSLSTLIGVSNHLYKQTDQALERVLGASREVSRLWGKRCFYQVNIHLIIINSKRYFIGTLPPLRPL